jgi:hypothetical protein
MWQIDPRLNTFLPCSDPEEKPPVAQKLRISEWNQRAAGKYLKRVAQSGLWRTVL